MKICFITNDIFTLGGVQRVLSVLSNELSKKHEVEIICTNKEKQRDENLYYLSKDIKVIYNVHLMKVNIIKRIIYKLLKMINNTCGVLKSKVNILEEINYNQKVKNNFIEYINDNKYDIVIGVEGKYSLLLGLINNRINAKSIGWFHNSYEAYFRTKGKYYWNMDILFKNQIPNLDKCIVLTDHDKYLLKGKMKLKCKRIYNPLSFISEIKSKGNSKNIICVARLVEQQKGLDMLIEAFAIVSNNNSEWSLTIVGDGPDKEKLIKRINNKKLEDKIKIIPYQKDIKKYYLKSDFFISSSRWEGFGLVITEAMECGLPVIAFDNSGPSEIIDSGINGILVPKNDINSLAENINYLIENKEEREKMAQKAIIRAKDFSCKSISEEWEKILIEVIGGLNEYKV